MPHRPSVGSLECDAVDNVLAVELLVVGLGHVPRNKGSGIRVLSPTSRFSTGCFQLLYRTDGPALGAVFGGPNGNGNALKPRAAEVPVVQVFQPLAESSRPRACRLPANGFVQLLHALLAAVARMNQPSSGKGPACPFSSNGGSCARISRPKTRVPCLSSRWQFQRPPTVLALLLHRSTPP